MRTLRARVGAVVVVTIAIIGACKYTSPFGGAVDDAPTGADDAPLLQDAYVPDAGSCLTVGAECTGPTLRVCNQIGMDPVDTMCPWGCSVAGVGPHCALLQPTGGAVQPGDLLPTAGLLEKDFTAAGGEIDTDDGSISGIRNAGVGIENGIEYIVRGDTAVFRFQRLTIEGFGGLLTLNVRGSKGLAIVALDGITLKASLDATDGCGSNGTAIVGGFAGGDVEQTGSGSGGGESGDGSNGDASGGAGGGYGGGGGGGGSGMGEGSTTGGTSFGDATILVLRGGAGGGGGGGTGARGGAGGGAIQLVSNGTIRIEGGINAGGCGGQGTQGGAGGGGGGGAGGTIVIEAPIVQLSASSYLTVNGGGGGGADEATQAEEDGERAQRSQSSADGGASGSQGGDGGDGAANTTLTGGAGQNANKAGGGGGGGVGRIRINTYSPDTAQISDNAVFSPRRSAPSSTSTLGLVNVQ